MRQRQINSSDGSLKWFLSGGFPQQKYKLMSIKYLFLIISASIGTISLGQEAGLSKPLKIRATFVIPNPAKQDLFIQTSDSAAVKLNLVGGGFGEIQNTISMNGMLNLFKSPTIDPNNPKANLVATAKVPASATRVMAMIIPAAAGASPPFNIVLLDDDSKSFPWGESKVINLSSVDFALEAGEHKIKIPKGEIKVLPEVKGVNEFKIAQTNFFSRGKDTWEPVIERQLSYLNNMRRVFVVYKIPKALGPEVRILTDHLPAVPQNPR
jgi:hypothetical protein